MRAKANEGGTRPHREDLGFPMEEEPIFTEGLEEAIGEQLQIKPILLL